MKERESALRHIAYTVIIVLLTAACYINTLDSPFYLDDKSGIIGNQFVHDLKYFADPAQAEGLKGHQSLNRRYVGFLSFALNYRAHGFDTRGYHIVNLLIHMATSLLLYLLVLQTFRTPALARSTLRGKSAHVALLAALLFAVHPLQTQAVTYIIQRLASLATMFYIAAIVSYVSARSAEGKVRTFFFYTLCLFAALMSMKTKEIAFTLPLAILLYEFTFFGTGSRKRAVFLAAIAVLMMVVLPLGLMQTGVSFKTLLTGDHKISLISKITRQSYMMTELRVLVTYLRLMVLPVNQSLIHDNPVFSSFTAPPVLASFALLAGMFLSGIYLLWRSKTADPALRIPAFGIFFFFIALSVESTIIPLYPIYEHRMYLPSTVMFMGISAAISLAIAGMSGFRKRASAVFVIGAVLLVLCAATFHRNTIWQNPLTFWNDVVRKSPRSIIGHNNLANTYSGQGLHERAIHEYRKALELSPESSLKVSGKYFSALNYNLAHEYALTGLNDKAIEHYTEAIELDARNPDAHNNLGVIYFNKGMTDTAIEHYRKAIEINPNHAVAHVNLSEAFLKQNEIDKAIEFSLKSLRYMPDLLEAHRLLAQAYQKKGRYAEAQRHLRKALEIESRYRNRR